LYSQEGYMFLAQPPQKETEVYRYQLTIFQQSNETLRGIHTQYIHTETRTFSNSFEQIKLKLIKQFTDLPNPSTYLITSKLKFPLNETLIPVAKRLLVKHLLKAA
jgi:hypothetical protein